MNDSELCINEDMPRLTWQAARVDYANNHRPIYKTMTGKEKRGILFVFQVIIIQLS